MGVSTSLPEDSYPCFTALEVTRLAARFCKIDSDKSGTISVSEFLSLPMPASRVTLWVLALALVCPPEEVEEEVVVVEDAEGGFSVPPVPKKLVMIPQRTVRGVSRSQTRDMKSPL